MPVFVWLGSWVMYALGEFVEDTHAMRKKYYPAAEEQATEQAALEALEAQRQAAEAQHKAAQAQLGAEELEEAASRFLGWKVSLSDIACTLIYVIPQSTGQPKEMHLDMYAGQYGFTSLDLFFDQNRKAYYYRGRQLALDSAWCSEKEIFGFDVSLFKSFRTEVDSED